MKDTLTLDFNDSHLVKENLRFPLKSYQFNHRTGRFECEPDDRESLSNLRSFELSMEALGYECRFIRQVSPTGQTNPEPETVAPIFLGGCI